MSKRAIWILGIAVCSPFVVKLLAIIAWLGLNIFDRSKVWPYPTGTDTFYAALLGLMWVLIALLTASIVVGVSRVVYTEFFPKKASKPSASKSNEANPKPSGLVTPNIDIDTATIKLEVAKLFNKEEADKDKHTKALASISKEECIKLAMAKVPDAVEYAINNNNRYVILSSSSISSIAGDYQHSMFISIMDDIVAILNQMGIVSASKNDGGSAFVSMELSDVKKFSNHELIGLLE